MTDSSGKRVLAKEVFLHLLSIITLYFSAASFVTLLFQYVNILSPDVLPLEGGYYSSYPFRFAVSSLIVVFPVFIIVSWFLNMSYLRDPEKREFKLRKWLVYFTLFVAALIMIGDLVALVYNFLGGGIALQFVLKALSLLFTAGAIFWYYLSDIRREGPVKTMKPFVWGVSAVVGVAIIGAFILVGSPGEERLYKFDDRRISNLDGIQWQILSFWQNKDRLPETLGELTDEFSGYQPPTDPDPERQGMAYEYRVIPGERPSFELCAAFNRPSRTIPGNAPKAVRPVYPDERPFVEVVRWEHGEGRACFTRTIDPERYRLPEKMRPQ